MRGGSWWRGLAGEGEANAHVSASMGRWEAPMHKQRGSLLAHRLGLHHFIHFASGDFWSHRSRRAVTAGEEEGGGQQHTERFPRICSPETKGSCH